MGAFSLRELTEAANCVRKPSTHSDLNLQKLPPELLAQILRFLPGKDIATAARTCKRFYEASQIDIVWQQLSKNEFGMPDYVSTQHMTYKELYTKLLYNYGSLLGFWQTDITSYGGLIQVKYSNGRIIGEEWLPPKNQNLRGPLRQEEMFSISLNPDRTVSLSCRRGYSGAHKCLIYRTKLGFTSRCCDPERHRHPAGEQQEFTEWIAEEATSHLLMYGDQLMRMKFFGKRHYENSYEYRRIEFPLPLSNVPIQPGLFKGTYATHGLELIMLRYDEDGTKALAIKITGDPNVPASEVTFRADLSFPMILDAEKQMSIRELEGMKSVIPPMSPHKLPIQPFRVPDQCVERVRDVPQFCKSRFYGSGQIAGHGFTNPSYSQGHWIIFNEDLFGFLWLELLSLSVYHRVTDVDLHHHW